MAYIDENLEPSPLTSPAQVTCDPAFRGKLASIAAIILMKVRMMASILEKKVTCATQE